jgi:hypothetical protein
MIPAVTDIEVHAIDPPAPPPPTFDVRQAARQALADCGHFHASARWTSTKNTRPDPAEPSTAALTSGTDTFAASASSSRRSSARRKSER